MKLDMYSFDKLCEQEVNILPIPSLDNGELSEVIVRQCCFCEKEVVLRGQQKILLERMSGPPNFYCTFCLRNGLHTKNNRNILVLSFRSIIGFFYHEFYCAGFKRLSFSEIEDYIAIHVKTGLVNPVFQYDYDTMLWFLDFSRIGNSKKKINLDDIHKTIINILACFNLANNVPGLSLSYFYQKYHDAIMNFHTKRYRPDGRRLLIPTFSSCGTISCSAHGLLDQSRNFTNMQMIFKGFGSKTL